MRVVESLEKLPAEGRHARGYITLLPGGGDDTNPDQSNDLLLLARRSLYSPQWLLQHPHQILVEGLSSVEVAAQGMMELQTSVLI